MAKPKRAKDPRIVSPRFVTAHRHEIATAMRANLRAWKAQGWRVVGEAPDLRIEVSVPLTVQNPKAPIGGVRIAGRTIKPAVTASHAQIRRERQSDGSDPTAVGLAHAIAPGARVRAGRGRFQEFVGIAAVLVVDGTTSILTCGHPRAFNFSDQLLAGDEQDGTALATVAHNFLEDGDPIDAALCPVTDDGLRVLEGSAGASTWQFRTIKTPGPEDNGQESVFWQTHDGPDDAPTAPVDAFMGENSALFGARGPTGPFIQTAHAVVGGDSGSLLSLGTSLYGICSGFIGFTAFFTPIAAVIARLKSEGRTCSVYDPAAN